MPYPTQAYHYGPRHVGPSHTAPPGPGPAPALMPHPGVDGAHGPPRAPAPYGLISDLPLPVPTGDYQVITNIVHIWIDYIQNECIEDSVMSCAFS